MQEQQLPMTADTIRLYLDVVRVDRNIFCVRTQHIDRYRLGWSDPECYDDLAGDEVCDVLCAVVRQHFG